MTNSFKIGDLVEVLSLKRSGTVIAILGKNSIKVAIGDLQMNCKLSDLILSLKLNVKSLEQKRFVSTLLQRSKKKSPTSIDLHGHTAKAAKEALLTFISDAVMSGHQQVTVIHGHGSGIVKDIVHATLANLEMVASFRHPINSKAETKIYFR